MRPTFSSRIFYNKLFFSQRVRSLFTFLFSSFLYFTFSFGEHFSNERFETREICLTLERKRLLDTSQDDGKRSKNKETRQRLGSLLWPGNLAARVTIGPIGGSRVTVTTEHVITAHLILIWQNYTRGECFIRKKCVTMKNYVVYLKS